jgi:anti-anti-sigma factor
MIGEPTSPSDQVFVAIAGNNAVVKVEGRGSFKVSASLKQFGDTILQKRISFMIVDMAHCIGMDSTFMGVLAGLGSRLKVHDGRIALVNCTPRTRGLVATLGLDQLIQAYEMGKTPPAYTAILLGREPDKMLESVTGQDAATMRAMLDAHQNLVDLVPDNLPQFKDVLVFLREEIGRKSGGPQGA